MSRRPFRAHWHFRGHVPGYVPATLVTGFGSPTGICFYESDAFGPEYKNVALHTDPGPRVCRAYRHELTGFGMKGTSEIVLSNKGDNYFRPDDICTAPDGRLYVSDWYDGSVGGHGYNNPDQGRIFLLLPKGKNSRVGKARALRRRHRRNRRTEEPQPRHAVSGARERLLAEGQQCMAPLVAMLSDAEPNHRESALWLLDRIAGTARQIVVYQLKSDDAAMRALAVRILRRHGAERAAALLALADDPAPEVRREVLLAIRTLQGEKAEEALAKIAATYDGSDRYQLEAINIAVGDRKAGLLARLEKKVHWASSGWGCCSCSIRNERPTC